MAISVTPQSGALPLTTRRCACVAGWLSVALVVLLSSGVCRAQALPPGVQYIGKETLPAGGYRWKYYIWPVASGGQGTRFAISGVHGVTAAGSVNGRGRFTVTFAPEAVAGKYSVFFAWNSASTMLGNTRYPAPANPSLTSYFYYDSTSATDATVNWTRTDTTPVVPPELGTTTAAGTPPDVPSSVSVYDNWIGFGALNPTQGTSAAPAKIIASKLAAGSWAPTTGLGVDAYDVGYVQINATRRLNLSVRMNGHLKRCTPTGQAFAGVDTRKQTPGPYELATQWKVGFGGRFLTALPAAAPYSSPTSGQVTDYNLRTGWSTGGNDPVSDSGWLWPSATDAWTGQAVGIGYTPLSQLDLVVERGQYTGGTYSPASIAIIERVLRRGQQDVEGNYRQVIDITLTYAE